jgi:Reverse transcriptase (RNA-dependent DNA polymerase)
MTVDAADIASDDFGGAFVFLPTGAFDKLKARLVAGGNQQDRQLYDDLSAPTVSTSSVFSILAVAAHEGRHIAVTDIGGAFLHADMTTGVDVYMRLDRVMTDMLVSAEKKYRPYVDDKGCLVVKLDKALYGCVESAALWYEHLATTLKSLGYETNDYDTCVFNYDGIPLNSNGGNGWWPERTR